jgi:hypothetical protein
VNATQNETLNATANQTLNATQNQTAQNQTVPKIWEKYSGARFSFDYPANMNLTEDRNGPNGAIVGQHNLPERTAETLAVAYTDTKLTYGLNRDGEFRSHPSTTPSDLLLEDIKNDTMGFFMKASEIGSPSTFSIGREIYGAELPFKLVLNSGTTYTGYAITLYVPERSLVVDVRILALDPDIARNIEQQFLLSFRIE